MQRRLNPSGSALGSEQLRFGVYDTVLTRGHFRARFVCFEGRYLRAQFCVCFDELGQRRFTRLQCAYQIRHDRRLCGDLGTVCRRECVEVNRRRARARVGETLVPSLCHLIVAVHRLQNRDCVGQFFPTLGVRVDERFLLRFLLCFSFTATFFVDLGERGRCVCAQRLGALVDLACFECETVKKCLLRPGQFFNCRRLLFHCPVERGLQRARVDLVFLGERFDPVFDFFPRLRHCVGELFCPLDRRDVQFLL